MKMKDTTEGPLGIPMRDEQARAVEALIKDLPAECQEMGLQRMTIVGKKIEVDVDARTDVSMITSNAVDRDNEVVLAAGADWKQFKRNPVVTFAHDYRALPIGRNQWILRQAASKATAETADGWLAKTEYASRPPDWEGPWLPDDVLHLVAKGFLPGKSIGFIPTEMRAPEEKEIEARPELVKVSRIITKWLALEYAVATVQSNPDALVQHVSKMADRPAEDLLETLGIVLPGPVEPTRPIEIVTPKAVESAVLDTDAIMAQIAAGAAIILASVPGMVETELDRRRGRV